MDLTLTWRGDYVVRAALALAAASEAGGGAWVKASAVAAATAIPAKYAPQILTELVHADLVETRAGRQGGYRLRRSPSDVSLLDVVEAAEGELVNRRCVLRGRPCGRRGTCAIHDVWARAQQALRSELTAVTLADVLRGEGSASVPLPRQAGVTAAAPGHRS